MVVKPQAVATDPPNEVSAITPDGKVLSRWLPRVNDPSSEVRRDAATELGKLAARSPAYREQVLPILLQLGREERHWPVITDGIVRTTASIPKTDVRWLLPYVDLYIHLARSDDDCKRECAYEELWALIAEAVISDTMSRFPEILAMARNDAATRTGDERKHIIAILDWYEDRNCNAG